VVSVARRPLGAQGEDAVAEWYRRTHYEILARNWRCPAGELDLVARGEAGDVIVFCEVKTRLSNRFGTGFEAVTVSKQQRLRRLAAQWLATRRQTEPVRFTRVRFDVAAVTRSSSGSLEVEMLEDAF
jgi:putative endonuclease